MNIFLSTPISSFSDNKELIEYKKNILSLIKNLKKEYSVCSEIEKIYKDSDYDTPAKSIEIDMMAIKKCDIFIMHYPKSVATSALIELGFAMAFNKRIIIICPQKEVLPYLALGISDRIPESAVIESSSINLALIKKIKKLL